MQPEADDRRDGPRQGPDVEPTFLWLSVKKSLRVRVIDVSDSGLGVFLEGDHEDGILEVGFQVRVEHEEGRRTASVVWMVPEESGYRVGLKWADQ